MAAGTRGWSALPSAPPKGCQTRTTALALSCISTSSSDPDWDYTKYDFSTWEADTAATAEILNATDTDLSAFRDGGGKIIYWTGWSDLALTPLGTIDYYEQLEAGDSAARDYARLYMLPGVLHCAGGPGPDRVDWIEAIRTWVEEDTASERLIASKLDASGSATMTRPVCPYPQEAVYDGQGDPKPGEQLRLRDAGVLSARPRRRHGRGPGPSDQDSSSELTAALRWNSAKSLMTAPAPTATIEINAVAVLKISCCVVTRKTTAEPSARKMGTRSCCQGLAAPSRSQTLISSIGAVSRTNLPVLGQHRQVASHGDLLADLPQRLEPGDLCLSHCR